MRKVTLNGTAYEVSGQELTIGSQVPDFEFQVVTPDGPKPKRLSDYAGKTVLFSVTPSIDTGVCAVQAKNFDDRAASLPDGVKIVNVSADLPFAQDRFAKESGSSHIEFASDHKDLSFGKAFGVIIPSHRLLQRSAFVVDGSGRVIHAEYIPIWNDPPNFDAALNAAK